MQEDWNAFASATASVEAASGKEPAPGIVQMASEASKRLSKLPVAWVECAAEPLFAQPSGRHVAHPYAQQLASELAELLCKIRSLCILQRIDELLAQLSVELAARRCSSWPSLLGDSVNSFDQMAQLAVKLMRKNVSTGCDGSSSSELQLSKIS